MQRRRSASAVGRLVMGGGERGGRVMGDGWVQCWLATHKTRTTLFSLPPK